MKRIGSQGAGRYRPAVEAGASNPFVDPRSVTFAKPSGSATSSAVFCNRSSINPPVYTAFTITPTEQSHMSAAAGSHLPYEVPEDDYREDAQQRYREINNDADTIIGNADGDIGTGEFAVAIASWIGTRQRQHGLVPSSTLPTSASEYEWFDEYVADSYRAGREFAREYMEANGISPPRTPGVDRSPRHQRGLQTAHERQRRYWNSLATDLRNEVKTTLTQQLDSGATIQQARGTVADRVANTGLHRARLIAETEPAWAFNRAMVEEAADAGIQRVAVDMSWETAGDNRVCAECSARSGSYTPGAARDMLESGSFPAHSLCRCLLVPSR